jgi:C-terminal processing protease CtpA/Prc
MVFFIIRSLFSLYVIQKVFNEMQTETSGEFEGLGIEVWVWSLEL